MSPSKKNNSTETAHFEQHRLMVPCTKYSMGSLQPVLLFSLQVKVQWKDCFLFRNEPSPIASETLSEWVIGLALGLSQPYEFLRSFLNSPTTV